LACTPAFLIPNFYSDEFAEAIVRTTLTFDEDVAARLSVEARRSGRSFKDTVNDALRAGLEVRRKRAPVIPFRVQAKDLGPSLVVANLDSIARLLDDVDGARAP